MLTVESMEAAQAGDEQVWKEILRELEEAGITMQMITEHREFIAAWVIEAMNSNELEEVPPADVSHVGPTVHDGIGANSASLDLEPFQHATTESDHKSTSDGESDLELSEKAGAEGPDKFLTRPSSRGPSEVTLSHKSTLVEELVLKPTSSISPPLEQEIVKRMEPEVDPKRRFIINLARVAAKLMSHVEPGSDLSKEGKDTLDMIMSAAKLYLESAQKVEEKVEEKEEEEDLETSTVRM